METVRKAWTTALSPGSVADLLGGLASVCVKWGTRYSTGFLRRLSDSDSS